MVQDRNYQKKNFLTKQKFIHAIRNQRRSVFPNPISLNTQYAGARYRVLAGSRDRRGNKPPIEIDHGEQWVTLKFAPRHDNVRSYRSRRDGAVRYNNEVRTYAVPKFVTSCI